MMKLITRTLCLSLTVSLSVHISQGQRRSDCLCIASEVVRKYCEADKSSIPKTEYQKNQEAIARRDIQRLINQSIEADLAKDATAKSFIESPDLRVKELDGKIFKASEIGASTNNYQGIIKISEDTKITIECLTIRGEEAIVYVNQHFVRYVPDRLDKSPHEVITNIIHRETWIFTDNGWKVRYIEEVERGGTYLDGKLYNPG